MSIIINLNSNNIIFTDEQIIHQDELSFIQGLIKDNLGKIEEKKKKEFQLKNLVPDYAYNTILINGSRGSGKTSFLLSLLQTCNKDEGFSDLEILPFLDPTMIEEKAHIFLTVISLIKNKVERKFDNNEDYTNLGRRKDWEDRLFRLSKGFPIIDGVTEKKPDYWDDASQIMYKGLEDVDAAFNLRKNFNDFIDDSLQILEKKAFLLVIDDVDTAFNKAWPVMEMIRKYICSDKIISVVSGDYRLFSCAARKNQWKNFGESLLINEYDKQENDNSKEYLIQVNEVENQYLKKIFPTENRINLHSLYELIAKKKEIIIKKDNKDNSLKPQEQSITEFYKQILSSYGIKNDSQCIVYIQFLERLSLRTQIQFMRLLSLNDIEKVENTEKINIINIFISELIQNNININLLTENRVYFMISLLRFLTESNKLFDCYQLEPISDSESINACLFTFSLLLSYHIKADSLQIINYIIRIGYVRNLIPYLDVNKNNGKLELVMKALINGSGLYNDNDLHQISGYITSCIRSIFRKDAQSFAGTISLPGFAVKAKEAKSSTSDSFDSVINNLENQALKTIACIPLSVSSYENKSATVNNYSFFALLAGIFDIVNEYRQVDEKNKELMFADIVSRVGQIRNYPMFEYTANNYILENNQNIVPVIISDNNIDTNKWSSFHRAFERWLNNNTSDIIVSSYVLGKICTRTMAAFDNITTNQRNKDKKLGELMNLFICAFFNACIIEEIQDVFEIDKMKINRDNILSSNKNFQMNLEKVKFLLEENKMPVTRYFITCPILLAFVDTVSFPWDSLKSIMKTGIMKELNLYNSLECVSVKSNNSNGDGQIEFREWNSEQIFEKLKDINYSFKKFMEEDPEIIQKDMKKYFAKCVRTTKYFIWQLNELRNKLKGKNSF